MAQKKNQGTSGEAGALEGRYANYFKIGYNAFEFVLDFGQQYNRHKKPILHTRIIISPAYVDTLIGLLQKTIQEHSATYPPAGGEEKN